MVNNVHFLACSKNYQIQEIDFEPLLGKLKKIEKKKISVLHYVYDLTKP